MVALAQLEVILSRVTQYKKVSLVFISTMKKTRGQPFMIYDIFPSVIVDGSWGQWAQWSMCSKTCGDGAQVRSRVCDDPKPAAGGATCVGAATQDKYCRTRDCCKCSCIKTKLKILYIKLVLQSVFD